MYSQRDEEKYIHRIFADKADGRFLEIGAYHPKTFSNTRALVERGWGGVYVEPSARLLKAFREEYKDNDNISIVPKAVAEKNGIYTFYDSQGDAVGTLDPGHKEKWSSQVDFKEVKVEGIDVPTLLNRHGRNFDFINIDIEGLDFEVLKQFDFSKMITKAVCVEYNSIDEDKYRELMMSQGFIVYHQTAENLIFAR